MFSPRPKSTQTVIRHPWDLNPGPATHGATNSPLHHHCLLCMAQYISPSIQPGSIFSIKTFTPGGTRIILCKILWYLEVLGLINAKSMLFSPYPAFCGTPCNVYLYKRTAVRYGRLCIERRREFDDAAQRVGVIPVRLDFGLDHFLQGVHKLQLVVVQSDDRLVRSPVLEVGAKPHPTSTRAGL